MNKQSQLGARLMHTIDRINRDKSLSKPQKREILKKGLKGIRKIRNMNMGGVMRGRGGTSAVHDLWGDWLGYLDLN